MGALGPSLACLLLPMAGTHYVDGYSLSPEIEQMV